MTHDAYRNKLNLHLARKLFNFPAGHKIWGLPECLMNEKKLLNNIAKALEGYQKGTPLSFDKDTLSGALDNPHLKQLLNANDVNDILPLFNPDNTLLLKRWGRALRRLEIPPFGISCAVIGQMMDVMNSFDNWDLGTSGTFSLLHKVFPNLKHDLHFFFKLLEAGINPFQLPYDREDMWECVHFCLLFYPEKADMDKLAGYLLDMCTDEEYPAQEYLMRRNLFYRLLLEQDGLI